MSTTTDRVIHISPGDGQVIDSLVESGAYSDEAEVVSSALHALSDRDAAFELWLHQTVVPILEEEDAGNVTYLSAEEALEYLRTERQARV